MNSEKAKAKQRSRRGFRFSLRTLLIVLTIAGVWLGMRVERASQQRRAVEILKTHRGSVTYDWQQQGRKAPSGLRAWIGEHYFQELVAAGISGREVPDAWELDEILKVRSLRRISFWEMRITRSMIDRLCQLPCLQEISFRNSELTDKQLLTLVGSKAKRVDATGSHLSSAGAERFRELATDCELTAVDKYDSAYAKEFLSEFDTNGDGQLDESEWQTMPMARLPADPTTSDCNDDKLIDPTEFSNWCTRVKR